MGRSRPLIRGRKAEPIPGCGLGLVRAKNCRPVRSCCSYGSPPRPHHERTSVGPHELLAVLAAKFAFLPGAD